MRKRLQPASCFSCNFKVAKWVPNDFPSMTLISYPNIYCGSFEFQPTLLSRTSPTFYPSSNAGGALHSSGLLLGLLFRPLPLHSVHFYSHTKVRKWIKGSSHTNELAFFFLLWFTPVLRPNLWSQPWLLFSLFSLLLLWKFFSLVSVGSPALSRSLLVLFSRPLVNFPGKCMSHTSSTYTFTTCRILHPSDQLTSVSARWALQIATDLMEFLYLKSKCCALFLSYTTV